MPITRTFLDWTQPALPAVVNYLAGQFLRGTTLDLDNVVLVLPGGRASRRLTELLVELCEQNAWILLPPEHGTVGTLPEYLYESKRPFASDLVQQLAWVRALKDTDPEHIVRFTARLPDDDDHAHWMDLGALLQRQHRELAADAMAFADVAERGRHLDAFQEEDRWRLLSKVQERYLQILDGLQLWDLQTARLYAIDHRLCRTEKQVILVATTDMNVAMRSMLDQVADQVTALIHAPAELADRFDSHGCLIPERWQDVQLEIATHQIHNVQGPEDQADEVVRCLATCDGKYRADQIVVGVLDEILVPQLLRRLRQSQLAVRWVVGKTISQTAPYRLLEAVADYIERGRYIDFAGLTRHSDLAGWLAQQGFGNDWLTALDDYYNQHLQPRLGNWLGDDDESASLRQVVTAVHAALAPLQNAPRLLPAWAADIAQVLRTLYQHRELNVEKQHELYTLRSLEQLREGLLAQQQIPEELAPRLSAADAIRQLLLQVQNVQLPSPREDGQIELLGWLELPLDTAPALIVTGFNEGNVPTSVNSDLFLPNALRQKLDLVDNRRRYARDAYALSVLQASREELALIAGRFTADHDPLAPSRLALATDLHTMAERARDFFARADDEEPSVKAIHVESDDGSRSGIVVPRPLPLAQPITSISVTSFRTYLECPYRFYLAHVLRLQGLDDTAEELGPAAFGTLLHDVLRRFGEEPIRTASDPKEITRFLHHTLDQLVDSRYGQEHLPAVSVQLTQARQRLEAFARWQAQHTREGWEIVHTEVSGGEEPARLYIDADSSVILRGRIDRIDHKDRQWAIFDYKTGDRARTPQETHCKASNWIDLQLPLYVELARSLGIEGTPTLGYINLPKELDKVGAVIADWDEEVLESAMEEARQTAGKIVAGIFWPPTRPASGTETEFASICQEHAFRPCLEEPSTEQTP